MAEQIKFDALSDAVEEYGKDLVVNLIARLEQLDAYASGRLINSLTMKLQITINQLRLQISGENYFKYIEAGRKPGKFPPLAAIIKWCELKGIAKGAAFPIARKIGKFGIKPRPVLAEVIKETSDGRTDENLQMALKKDVEKYLDNILNKDK